MHSRKLGRWGIMFQRRSRFQVRYGRATSCRLGTSAPHRRGRHDRSGVLQAAAIAHDDGVLAFRPENRAVQVLTGGFDRNDPQRTLGNAVTLMEFGFEEFDQRHRISSREIQS